MIPTACCVRVEVAEQAGEHVRILAHTLTTESALELLHKRNDLVFIHLRFRFVLATIHAEELVQIGG